jgi:uncharacterized membrane protein
MKMTVSALLLASAIVAFGGATPAFGQPVTVPGPPLIGGPSAPPVSVAQVTIENYSNGNVYVAKAYRRGYTPRAEGWWTIPPNGTQTFSANKASDLSLRVENDGGEITFQNHNSFVNCPVTNDRFTVARPTDDLSIRFLRWGDALEHSYNTRQNGPLPEGWERRRFFRIGSGVHRLEVTP